MVHGETALLFNRRPFSIVNHNDLNIPKIGANLLDEETCLKLRFPVKNIQYRIFSIYGQKTRLVGNVQCTIQTLVNGKPSKSVPFSEQVIRDLQLLAVVDAVANDKFLDRVTDLPTKTLKPEKHVKLWLDRSTPPSSSSGTVATYPAVHTVGAPTKTNCKCEWSVQTHPASCCTSAGVDDNEKKSDNREQDDIKDEDDSDEKKDLLNDDYETETELDKDDFSNGDNHETGEDDEHDKETKDNENVKAKRKSELERLQIDNEKFWKDFDERRVRRPRRSHSASPFWAAETVFDMFDSVPGDMIDPKEDVAMLGKLLDFYMQEVDEEEMPVFLL